MAETGAEAETAPEAPFAIVVERLSKNVNEDHLREIFGQYGEIEDLDLPIGRTTGTNRGSAYILYTAEADAENAIAHMHEAQLDGAVINVSIVLPRRKISPAPPAARRGQGPPSGPRSGGPGGSNRFGPRSDTYRPRSASRTRSRSPPPPPPPAANADSRRYRSRSRSYSSRSRSRTRSPVARGGRSSRRNHGRGRHQADQGAREPRRSASRASYDSYGRRSRSRSRSRDFERR
ncbi:hypothetical protein B0T18DRAFT_388701 [Schizothecium vesticola]|uniref:RRM domain-containing protein n=1 Tax=Schizothecium vesticola TaxID=314040 RepID=A0AA40F0Q2_9PEZI|nr:hypothetical protein B0T18DRAFT_388701 [Schizothecium vesticola]